MDDIQFREIVERVVTATQDITWGYVDLCGSALSVETEQVLAIVGYTLVSNLICRSEMTEEQREQLWNCVCRGEKDPDNCKPLDKSEIN